MKRVPRWLVVFGITAITITSVTATFPDQRWAEDWPTHPLTLVVPFSAAAQATLSHVSSPME
jgi:hypothetical protein